jgi:hypothetical protein
MSVKNSMNDTIAPVAGEAFRAGLKVGIEDKQDLKVAALLGAYRDAGIFEPRVKELAARCQMSVEEIDSRLESLEPAS